MFPFNTYIYTHTQWIYNNSFMGIFFFFAKVQQQIGQYRLFEQTCIYHHVHYIENITLHFTACNLIHSEYICCTVHVRLRVKTMQFLFRLERQLLCGRCVCTSTTIPIDHLLQIKLEAKRQQGK